MNVGRIIGTAVVGFLFLLFVALDLVLFGVLALNSVMVTVLPAAKAAALAPLDFRNVRRLIRISCPPLVCHATVYDKYLAPA